MTDEREPRRGGARYPGPRAAGDHEAEEQVLREASAEYLADALGPDALRTVWADEAARAELRVREAARALMTVRGITQAALADALGVSQSSVHHMLTNRERGLGVSEVLTVERLAGAPTGTIYENASLIEWPNVEEQIWHEPGIAPQTAEAIVAALHAARANALREKGLTPWGGPPD